MQYSKIRANFPTGLSIGGVPVGQTDRQGAAEKLLEVYSLPIEIQYLDSVIHLDPSVVGFELDMESMLAAADQQRTTESFWTGFWDFLWNRIPDPDPVPLAATYSEVRLRTYLEQEVASRYDQPPVPAQPQPGTVNFSPGEFGNTLDIDGSVALIENSLFESPREPVSLPLERQVPPRPSPENLETLLRQTIDLAGFDGIAGLYLKDLQTGQEIHFLYSNGQILPVQPDAAFSATSLIKIPIMVSVFRRIDNSASPEVEKLLQDMIEKSGNDPADWLMDQVIDPQRGPLDVSDDMEELGLLNTFLAGYFAPGSPLLARYTTPANERPDINTEPDPYSQTTPADIGMLLEDIYQCAQLGGGALLAAFPNEVTQAECQEMINHLAGNRIAVLFEAGIPEATQIAHKHGWVTDINGVINTIGDAGIVYTPGGNYVLTVFLYHPLQLIWDPSSNLVADLSRAVYNFYNLPAQ
ncbi:MAG: serine hydrolase [Anaerolineales bacterium]|nr:serine hydrolase [Anaerolineales bacterium]